MFWTAVVVMALSLAPRAPPVLFALNQECRDEPGGLGKIPEPPVWVDDEDTFFAWPPPPHKLPRMEDALVESTVPLEAVRAWQLRSNADLPSEMGDTLMSGPQILLDRLVTAVQSLATRPRLQTLPRPGEESVYAGLFEFHLEPRRERPFAAFLGEWTSRERRYFSRFEDSRVTTVGFDLGTEDVDLEAFESDQEKLLWDALRNVYQPKHRFRPEDRIRDEAFALGQWRGLDFAVLPPLVGAYLWFRGLERRFTLAGTSLRISIEPLARWARDDDLDTAVAFEWSPSKDFLFSAIVLAGLEDGTAEIEFVGIGTSFGMARKSIVLQSDK